MITKNVLVEVRGLPITLSGNIKAFGVHGPTDMNEKDIFTCIAKGAYVWEVLPSGEKIKLDFINYNKRHNPKTYSTPIVEPTPADPKVESETNKYRNNNSYKYNKNKHKPNPTKNP